MTHPYAREEYAKAFAHLGRPFHVPEWSAWVLIREVQPGIEDAMGVYPLTILDEHIDLAAGLERLRAPQLVSVVLILDDIHRPLLDMLHHHFSVVKPFKTHYIRENRGDAIVYNTHHRYELRQALKVVRVGPMDLQNEMENWLKLYSNLVEHRKLSNLHVFPVEYHQTIGLLKGVTAMGAWKNDELVACHIWVSDGKYVHSHLAASSAEGYLSRAAYAVNDASLHYFADAKLINLGGGAGHVDNAEDGLTQFKQGFSNAVARSYICGVVLDAERYAMLNQQVEPMDFFPAYRYQRSLL